ncbi:MAG: hydroxyisourate hydrolase, partial [Chthoniobacterales bacterium]
MSLTTHVLDTVRGCPAAGLKIELWSLDSKSRLKCLTTNQDGRTDEPLLSEAEQGTGAYELI